LYLQILVLLKKKFFFLFLKTLLMKICSRKYFLIPDMKIIIWCTWYQKLTGYEIKTQAVREYNSTFFSTVPEKDPYISNKIYIYTYWYFVSQLLPETVDNSILVFSTTNRYKPLFVEETRRKYKVCCCRFLIWLEMQNINKINCFRCHHHLHHEV
jgi:hypothetical protein